MNRISIDSIEILTLHGLSRGYSIRKTSDGKLIQRMSSSTYRNPRRRTVDSLLRKGLILKIADETELTPYVLTDEGLRRLNQYLQRIDTKKRKREAQHDQHP